MDDVMQLFPQLAQSLSLNELYLSHNLRQYAAASGQAFVYANFVVSLDGRIAVPHPSGKGLMVPKNVANERDWRLFQELAAQADLIISSGRYLRDWADGRAQEILQTDDPRFADLREWRSANGLKPQPDIAIISASLKFPIPDVLTENGRKVIVFTTANPNPVRVREIEAKAGQVIVAGDKKVDGKRLVESMTELDYRTVYSAAGPKILHMLLDGGVLDRLYLTHAHRLLGGNPFSSIVEGELLGTAVSATLNTLYYDTTGVDGFGQLFISYNL